MSENKGHILLDDVSLIDQQDKLELYIVKANFLSILQWDFYLDYLRDTIAQIVTDIYNLYLIISSFMLLKLDFSIKKLFLNFSIE